MRKITEWLIGLIVGIVIGISVLVLVSLFMHIAALKAHGQSNGMISDGYTFTNGYWYWGETPYTRTQIWNPGYWSYGVYYNGYYSYSYSRAYPQQSAAPLPTPSATGYLNPNWRAELLKIASQRDKIEGQIRLGMAEQAYYMDAIKQLGLQGNFHWNGYGTVPPYVGGGYAYLPNGYTLQGTVTNYGATASTLYGYGVNNLSQLYGDGNIAALYQQSAQLTSQAQALGGQANQGFQQLVATEGQNRAKVAEILAKGQVAAQFLQALTVPSVQQQGFTFKVAPGGVIEKVDTGVDLKTKADLQKRFVALVTDKCAACHSAQNKKGGFDVGTYLSMTPQQKQVVMMRLVTPDDDKVMPRDPKGGPGKRLTQDELQLFFLN